MENQVTDDDADGSSSSESSDYWEEVPCAADDEVAYIKDRLENPLPEENDKLKSTEEPLSSTFKGTLKIRVPGVGQPGKKRKKGVDMIENYIVRELNKNKREVYRDLHRVALLCLMARGLRYNAILRQESILATALSILPSERSYPPKNLDLTYIEKFLSWFKGGIKVAKVPHDAATQNPAPITLEEDLLEQMGSRSVKSQTFQVFIFITILRALGVQVRLVWNLVPPPIKPESTELMKLLKGDGSDTQSPQPSSSKGLKPTKPMKPAEQKEENCKTIPTSGKRKSSRVRKEAKTVKSSKKLKKSQSDSDSSDSDVEMSDACSSSSDSHSGRRRKAPQKRAPAKGKAGSKKSTMVGATVPTPIKTSEKSGSGPRPGNSGRKFISSSEDEESKQKSTPPPVAKGKGKVANNFWPEVFLEEEEQWVSVDLQDYRILSDETLKAKATQPICYVIAFSNAGHIKDVTQRYSERWWTELGKLRDEEWWMETIKSYRGRKTVRDRREDEFLQEHLQSLPLPTTIAAYKNHPLYVIRRHLLKYEAIYPPDVIPCGFIRTEQVYPRSSVHTLNGRETWLRKARVVRIGEKPYKTVKARPKFTKNIGMVARDEPLELFGEWQTEDYQPPVASNGKVPRNEFGNVDLYMAKMLPIGTVHLQLPGLIRVARKLDVDCAPAVIGFEFNAGGCHPKFDGFVVCEEFKEIMLDAWNQEQDELKKREEERRLKRIYERWERLCKGLLIREKLEKRYAYTFNTNSSRNKTKQMITQV